MTDKKMPPLITAPPGRYRHYKGGLYEVVGTVRHSETLEPMTLYRALYDMQADMHGGGHGLWVRPAAMFNGQVEVDGPLGRALQPRFARLDG